MLTFRNFTQHFHHRISLSSCNYRYYAAFSALSSLVGQDRVKLSMRQARFVNRPRRRTAGVCPDSQGTVAIIWHVNAAPSSENRSSDYDTDEEDVFR